MKSKFPRKRIFRSTTRPLKGNIMKLFHRAGRSLFAVLAASLLALASFSVPAVALQPEVAMSIQMVQLQPDSIPAPSQVDAQVAVQINAAGALVTSTALPRVHVAATSLPASQSGITATAAAGARSPHALN